MKIKKTELKTCKNAYLYSDGHLIIVHSKHDKNAGEVNWVTVYKDIGIKVYFSYGRLILRPGVLSIISGTCRAINATKELIENGSKNSKELDIPMGSIILYSKLTDDYWIIPTISKLSCQDIIYQPCYETGTKIKDSFDQVKGCTHWSDYKIRAIYE